MANPKRQRALARLARRAKTNEDAAQRKTAQRQHELKGAEERHQDSVTRLQLLCSKRVGGTGDQFVQQRQHLAAIARAADATACELSTAVADVETARLDLLARARERKMLERLNERDRNTLTARETKTAQRALDELASQRALR